MTLSSGNRASEAKVQWSELLPYEFKARLKACPVVYLPLGICEPHGQISAFGLDTIKAEWLCREAAVQGGGIVAPALGYHIHESGYHARWLEETVGEENPHMTAMPPHVFIAFFLYQLRAFVNAGFQGIVVVSGHSGGNQEDLRAAADVFMKHVPVIVRAVSDPELAAPFYTGDHAGKYEISQMLYLRPELIDFDAAPLEHAEGAGGRLALGDDYAEATSQLGESIMNCCLDALSRLGRDVGERLAETSRLASPLTYKQMERIQAEVLLHRNNWVTASPKPGQAPVTSASRWKAFEYGR